MKDLTNIQWGFTARVHLKYHGNIHSLARELSDRLSLPDFIVDTDQDPPHEFFGMCQVLGLGIWINKSQDKTYKFLLEVETENSINEIAGGKMHNLSLWFARSLSLASDIETCVLDEEEVIAVFSKGNQIV